MISIFNNGSIGHAILSRNIAQSARNFEGGIIQRTRTNTVLMCILALMVCHVTKCLLKLTAA